MWRGEFEPDLSFGRREFVHGFFSQYCSFWELRSLLRTGFCLCEQICIWGSRDAAVVRALASHRCGPSSIPRLGVICGLSLLLVLVLAPRGFSPGILVFPSAQKPTLLNSNSIWKVSPIPTLNILTLK